MKYFENVLTAVFFKVHNRSFIDSLGLIAESKIKKHLLGSPPKVLLCKYMTLVHAFHVRGILPALF